jgi:translation initiation factor IF-3
MVRPLEIKLNAQIAASPVRVLGEDRTDLGIYSLAEACALARREGRDLIQIGPNDDPPTCRLIARAKFLFYRLRPTRDPTQTI